MNDIDMQEIKKVMDERLTFPSMMISDRIAKVEKRLEELENRVKELEE